MFLKLLIKLFLIVVFSSVYTAASAADRIGHIRIIGNDTTLEGTILREMLIHVGDEIDLDLVEQSAQNIMNLHLFESVDYYLAQANPDTDTELVITVVERIYFFFIPTAKTNDNSELEYGAKMIWNNVLGLNHTLKWKLLDSGSSAGVNEYKNQIKYSAPRILDSSYQLNIFLNQDVFVDDDPSFGLQTQRTKEIVIDILKWFNEEDVSAGYYAGFGMSYQSRDIRSLVSPTLSMGFNNAMSVRFITGYADVEEHMYNRSGVGISYLAQVATDSTGTAGNEFFLQELDYRQYISLSQNPPRNINFRFILGTSTNDVLGDKAFNLGGNTNLRGYEIGQFRGNTELIANIEYLSPLHNSPLVRKVFFIDAGEAVPNLSDINFENLNVGVGAGLRWKLRRFVNFNLRIDLAYGFETGKYRLAVGAKHTF